MAGINQSLTPVIHMLEQTGTLLGYWYGGKQILAGVFLSADLVIYIQQSNRRVPYKPCYFDDAFGHRTSKKCSCAYIE